jgi:hypothetical protein
MSETELLPVLCAAQLPRADVARSWLVEQLWGLESVGILAGHPKSGKSWLGLDLALSVASGSPCLGRYQVPQAAPVLIYLAEDTLPQVRQRLEVTARHRGLGLEDLALYAIAATQLRLDCAQDRTRLENTIRRHQPALLLLDPLVRLHQLDENDARFVAGLLSFLRKLQREHRLAVRLVHQARKNGGAAGLALRGSSDLWAWGDSNLYLRRSQQQLTLTVEHRSAASMEPIALSLVANDPERVHLEVTGAPRSQGAETETALALRLHETLRGGPLTRTQLRAALGIKNERLGVLLGQAEQAGTIRHGLQGWILRTQGQAAKATGRRSGCRDEAYRSLFPL